MKKTFSGWSFLETKGSEESTAKEAENIAFSFARVFGNGDGAKVLSYLEALTIGRALPPEATDAELRHLEGKRSLYFHIKSMIKNGQTYN